MPKTVTEQYSLYDGSVVIDYYPNSHRYKLISLDRKELDEKENIKSPSSIVGILDKSRFLVPWALNCFKDRMIEEMRDGVNFSKDDVLSMLNVAKGASEEKRKAAADVGSVVHGYAQNHHKSKNIEDVEGFAELSEEDKKKAIHGKASFDAWYSKLGAESVKSEFLVYSKRENFAGRCDDLVRINGELIILDYKTSKGIYAEQIYQVTAYMKAYEEEMDYMHTLEKIAGARLVHLCKEDIIVDGVVVMKAGEYGEIFLTRRDLVKAYKIFKALKDVAYEQKYFEALLKHHALLANQKKIDASTE